MKNKSHRKIVNVNEINRQNESAANKRLSYIAQVLGTLDQRIHNLEMGNSFTSSVEIYRTDVREIFLCNQPTGEDPDPAELENAVKYAFDAADMIEKEFSERMKARLEDARRKQEEEKARQQEEATAKSAQTEAEETMKHVEEELEKGKAEAAPRES